MDSHVPEHLDVRMRTWERTLGPQFQRQRVLQWTPEAQRIWDAQHEHQADAQPPAKKSPLIWLFVVLGIGAVVLILYLVGVYGLKLGCDLWVKEERKLRAEWKKKAQSERQEQTSSIRSV